VDADRYQEPAANRLHSRFRAGVFRLNWSGSGVTWKLGAIRRFAMDGSIAKFVIERLKD
jgi:hypothetical protein